MHLWKGGQIMDASSTANEAIDLKWSSNGSIILYKIDIEQACFLDLRYREGVWSSELEVYARGIS